jgi:hypothetical protein
LHLDQQINQYVRENQYKPKFRNAEIQKFKTIPMALAGSSPLRPG